jgi:large subunit ribosomal protein L6
MSKVGRLPISLPEGVSVAVENGLIKVSGPKGTLEKELSRGIEVRKKDNKIIVTAKEKRSKAMHGTTRAIIANMVHGVSTGWSKTLELVGVGYRAQVDKNTLTLTVGYSHPVEIEAPEGISFQVEKTDVTIQGIDKELVGQVAAKIRAVKPPEPYKGKGIKYKDEVIRRKPGKAAKAQGVGVS